MSDDYTITFTSDLTREDSAKITGLVATAREAWEAVPDDMTGDHDTLADAITSLVRQRDEAQAAMVDARPVLKEILRSLPKDLQGQHVADAVAALARQRDEALAALNLAQAERETLRKAWRDSQDEVFRARSAVGSRQAATLTAAEALDLALERLRGTAVDGAILTEVSAYIDGLRAGIGGAE